MTNLQAFCFVHIDLLNCATVTEVYEQTIIGNSFYKSNLLHLTVIIPELPFLPKRILFYNLTIKTRFEYFLTARVKFGFAKWYAPFALFSGHFLYEANLHSDSLLSLHMVDETVFDYEAYRRSANVHCSTKALIASLTRLISTFSSHYQFAFDNERRIFSFIKVHLVKFIKIKTASGRKVVKISSHEFSHFLAKNLYVRFFLSCFVFDILFSKTKISLLTNEVLFFLVGPITNVGSIMPFSYNKPVFM